MHKNLYEIFDEFEKQETEEDRIIVLTMNESFVLKTYLRGLLDPNVQFVFDKIPEYTPSDSPPGLAYMSMHQVLLDAYLFEKNNPRVSPNLTLKRKEELLIQKLEAMEAKEAELFVSMLKKKPSVKGLTRSVVDEAFPGLL